MKRIVFTVTNDLSFDQRMHRICHSLARNGYDVTLVGREQSGSLPLQKKTFAQERLPCFFSSGAAFYVEYNLRLFFFLLFKKTDCICSIDLDTILPGLLVSKLKRLPRVYDAHEYFTELKEVQTRKHIKRIWDWIERKAVPRFKHGYTVSDGIAREFQKKYNRNYAVIRNMPVTSELSAGIQREPFLFYQGAVNEGRAFEYLIPAMKMVPYKLVVCGDGNFMNKLKELIRVHAVEDRVELKGMQIPDAMWSIAQRASLGMGLAEKEGINQFLALPNKFFDYIQAGLPQLAMDYPEYRNINDQFEVAVLIDQLEPERIAHTINSLMSDQVKLERLRSNCLHARQVYCWENEERSLISFYNTVFGNG